MTEHRALSHYVDTQKLEADRLKKGLCEMSKGIMATNQKNERVEV